MSLKLMYCVAGIKWFIERRGRNATVTTVEQYPEVRIHLYLTYRPLYINVISRAAKHAKFLYLCINQLLHSSTT
jgi:hypothetical protein